MKRYRWLRWVVPFSLAAGLGFFLFAHLSAESRNFVRNYDDLRIGLTQVQVEAHFETEVDFKCAYRSSTVWYFRSPPDALDRFADTRGELDTTRHKQGTVYKSLGDLPQPYDYVTVAFGPDERVHAFTWIGEELHVRSKRGVVRGSQLSELLPADF